MKFRSFNRHSGELFVDVDSIIAVESHGDKSSKIYTEAHSFVVDMTVEDVMTTFKPR